MKNQACQKDVSQQNGKILYKMKSNKPPGSEFLKDFWKYRVSFAVRSINYGYYQAI